MKNLEDLDITNKKILIRVDFNVSINERGEITDDTRIKASQKTIDHLLNLRNKIILVSHFGRPKDREPKYSLKIVADYIQKLYPSFNIKLIDNFLSAEGKEQIENQKEGEIIILENIRFYKEEKENNPEFSKNLASLADIYVNDAFAVCHRAHASTVGVIKYLPAYAGFLVKKEVEMLAKIIKNPQKPLVVILAGAKISTKINLITSLMKLSNFILLGGGIANTLLKAKGYKIGQSLVEKEAISDANEILEKSGKTNCQLILPTDAVCGDSNDSKKLEIKKITDIPDNLAIFDIGPETQKVFSEIINQAKTILWNGPVGYFENPKFRLGTDAVYDAIIANSDAVSIVGGGDTLAAIKDKKGTDKITHISTGGGAMLEFIEKGTLPALESLMIDN